MLQLRNVNKIYGSGDKSVHALKNINIDFPDHGLIFVVGKSGSGKSTLLNLMGGLDKMSSGEVIIDGFSTNNFSGNDFNSFRNFYIGFIFQDFNLIEEMNVYQNIATVLKIQNRTHNNTNIDDVLKMVGLEGLGYRNPSELSGGQRQRIAIARALVKNPKIILADEPTGALDSKTGHDLISSLKNLAQEKLVIVVSHDHELANEYADQIFELVEGEIHRSLTLKDKANLIGEISDDVIRIPANILIEDPQFINKKFVKDKNNYLCINTFPDRVVLAYNETFDYLYNRENNEEKFIVEEPILSEVNYQKKHFERARIRIKELIKMAKQSVNRKRKRLSLLSILISFAMSFLMISLNVSQISMNSIVTLAMKRSSLPMANFVPNHYYGQQEAFSNENLSALKRGGINFAKTFEMTLPYIASESIKTEYSQNFYFNGIAEVESFNVTKMSLHCGTSELTNEGTPKVIITDYMADFLIYSGYLGYSSNQKLDIVHPNSYQEMIGTGFYLKFSHYNQWGPNDELVLMTISGIAKTNYKDIDDSEFYSADSYFLRYIFTANGLKEILYAASGQFSPTVQPSFTYETFYPNCFEAKYDLLEQNKILAGKFNGNLEKNQLIVTKQYAAVLLELDSNLLTKTEYDKLLDATYHLYYYNNYGNSIYGEYEIVAIYDSPNSSIYYDASNLDGLLTYRSLLVSTNMPNLTEKIKLLAEHQLYYGTDSYSTLQDFDNNIKSIITAFSVLAIIFATFGFLITFNFIGGSVRVRKKEIGILRASGARSSDVFNIFLTEIIWITSIIWLIAAIYSYLFISILDSSFYMYMQMPLVSFDFIDFIILGLITFTFLLLSAAIPIANIVRQKPIDSIKRE